jgi:hypothetical protein
VEVLVGIEGEDEEGGFFCAEEEGGRASMVILYGIFIEMVQGLEGEADPLRE